MTKITIGNKELIHFVGIGGIGMSGLAQIMKTMGFKIQGSDLNKNKNTDNCKKNGIKIFIGHIKKNISNATIVVKSSAIKKNNIEILEARSKKLPVYERADMLANIVSLKKNIIITGSHGKTTTTSLVAKILSDAKLDPTIINGGVINSLKSNAKFGRGDWTVLEADESDGSFLKLPINYSIVTNLDKEHLDFYKTFENLKKSFVNFINKTPPIGKAIICLDDQNLRNILSSVKIKNILTYGFNKKSNYRILNARYNMSDTSFDLKISNYKAKKGLIKNISLNLIGQHNVLNATSAIAICLSLGVKINDIKKSLKNFSGVQRRLTKIFTKKKIEFYDDYAHHPTEIRSVLNGLRRVYNKRKIISIFQPHRYSRVRSLKREFASSFSKSDIVILCPIYSAGEKKDKYYDEIKFAKMISTLSQNQVVLVKDEIDLKRFFQKNLLSDEIVIGMGAGSISNWIRNLKNKI
ncbi:MAG: UDP-N-acetylmuramate--L-alanine ligase [Pelagibacteraceae bacterium]